MRVYDFEYDGLALSDLGYMICSFDDNRIDKIENGSQIQFNTVPVLHGAKFELLSTKYENCIETTFQICKKTCNNDKFEIPFKEFRDLMNWLNRKQFHKFKLLSSEYLDLYFEASFNISKIEINSKIYGLELNLITNRPFALREPQKIEIQNNSKNGTYSFFDISDEEGSIYPFTQIEILESGNLSIYNDLDRRCTNIFNCKAGEIITMNYPIIQTSLYSHKIQTDFNWSFLRVASTFKNKKNKLSISLPCNIQMIYSPIVKIIL